MHDENQPRFRELLTAMAVTLPPRADLTPAAFMGYWLGLRDLPLEAFEQAVAMALETCKFLPAPAELRELAGVLRPDDRAVLAWDAVQKAYRDHGADYSLNFDDPAVNATLRSLGGLEAFADRMERDEEKWVRKDFERIYASYCRSGVPEQAALPLVGYYERMNRNNGYHAEADKQLVHVQTGLPALPGLPAPKQKLTKRLPAPMVEVAADLCKMPGG